MSTRNSAVMPLARSDSFASKEEVHATLFRKSTPHEPQDVILFVGRTDRVLDALNDRNGFLPMLVGPNRLFQIIAKDEILIIQPREEGVG